MIQLKDVIQYYIGQQFLYGSNPLPYTIKGIVPYKATSKSPTDEFRIICIDADRQWDEMPLDDHFRIILRLLEDMAEEEIKHLIGWEKMNLLYKDFHYKKHPTCINIEYTIDAGDEGCYPQFHSISFLNPTPSQFHYLLKQGFDLWGLIESGQAIDAKTIQPPQTQEG